MSGETQLSGPDLALGVSLQDLEDGRQLLGHFAGEPVLVVRRGGEVFAIGANCTHYGGPLAEGIVVWGTRCAVLGTTPVSACGPARRYALRP